MNLFRPRISRKWRSVSEQGAPQPVRSSSYSPPRDDAPKTQQNAAATVSHRDDLEEEVPENKTMFQAFEWYSPGALPDLNSVKLRYTSHWTRLTETLPTLHKLGVTSIWIPPACKATNVKDNGYGVYDLFDLGEFDQKGTVSTKWGSKAELQTLCHEAEKLGIGIIFDAVLNHRAAADSVQRVQAVRVNEKDRRIELDKPHEIEAWTVFDYKGRGGKHSAFKCTSDHFSGTSWDGLGKTKGIFKYVGGKHKGWAKDVDTSENGNYDYLMFENVDYSNEDIRNDVLKWGAWLPQQLPGVTGIRLDAAKHYSATFQRDFIKYVQASTNKNFFFVGEYWKANSKLLAQSIDKQFGGDLHLFDVKLVYNLSEASKGIIKDLRKVLKGTLVEIKPKNAVTFAANHDTQETQSLEAPIQQWFVPHANALILLREGGLPCVFSGDVYGNAGPSPREPACGGRLARLVLARKLYAYGAQKDYFNDDPSCVGWTRMGHPSRSGGAGLAVVISNNWNWRKKRMLVGKQHAGRIWTDVMGWAWSGVQIDDDGYGEFPVAHRSISVWVPQNAPGRKEIDKLVYPRLDLVNEADEVAT